MCSAHLFFAPNFYLLFLSYYVLFFHGTYFSFLNPCMNRVFVLSMQGRSHRSGWSGSGLTTFYTTFYLVPKASILLEHSG